MKNADKFTFRKSFLSSMLGWLTGLLCLPPLPRPLPQWPQCHYLVTNLLPLGCLPCTGSSIPDHVDTKPNEMSIHTVTVNCSEKKQTIFFSRSFHVESQQIYIQYTLCFLFHGSRSIL